MGGLKSGEMAKVGLKIQGATRVGLTNRSANTELNIS